MLDLFAEFRCLTNGLPTASGAGLLGALVHFGLDAMGHRFWVALVESESVAEASRILLEEYEVAPDQLEHDLSALMRTLIDHGLLKMVAPSA